MMRYLPARGVIVPATVAFAAGCRAEISNMPAPAPAKVIARHTGTPKAPGYVACTAPTDPNIPLGPAWRVPRSTRIPWIPAHRAAAAGLPDTPAQAPLVQAESARPRAGRR